MRDRSLDLAGCVRPIDGAAKAHSGSERTAGMTGPLPQPPPRSASPGSSAAVMPVVVVVAASESDAALRVNYSGCSWWRCYYWDSCLRSAVVVLNS